jgi:hypothetical protein
MRNSPYQGSAMRENASWFEPKQFVNFRTLVEKPIFKVNPMKAVHTFFVCLVMFAIAPLSAQEMIKPGKEHALLAETVGTWDVDFGSPGGDMKGKCTYKMAHGGLWLTSELDAKMAEGPFTGQGLDSYDPVKKKYVSVWIDSMSPTPVILEGDRSADGKTITMTGKGPGMDGKQVDFKTVTEFVSKDKHVFKLWMGDTQGEPMMTATYQRAK